MTDAFSRCHPVLNFFYFAVVLGFTMFIQHPVYLAVSFVAATAYSMWLNGVKKVLKINFLLTLPSLLIVALLNPMFNHYGVTPLLYIESSGNLGYAGGNGIWNRSGMCTFYYDFVVLLL